MMYFDNAATSLPKPAQVLEAVASALTRFGSVGRGIHESALVAGMAVFEAREKVAHLFGAHSAQTVAFALNATEALNIVIEGLLVQGDHAITTAASHNSILRPLYRKEREGVELSILPVSPQGAIDYSAFDDLFRDNTRLVVVTHASNLTGDVYDIARMAKIAHEHGAIFAVDAAQTAGVIDIDMERDDLDIVVFTGHKSLFGPQGTGGLCVKPGIEIPPFKVGGSGTHTYDHEHPTPMPERLEAGTLNAHGIAGLSAGLEYLEDMGRAAIHERIGSLVELFEESVACLPGVTIYGGRADVDRCGIVALNIEGMDSGEVSDILASDYGIATRSGAHCAPLMHEALGTTEQGTVRFSFSHFNTEDEVQAGISAITTIVVSSHSSITASEYDGVPISSDDGAMG